MAQLEVPGVRDGLLEAKEGAWREVGEEIGS